MSDAERYAAFARLGADWLWETDSQDRFSYFSATTSKAGIPLAGRIGATRRDGAVTDAANLASLDALAETIARRQPFGDVVYHAQYGSEPARWCSIRGEPRYDPHGAFIGYRGVGRDVTLQVEAQQGLEIQSRALQDILQAIPDGVQLVDRGNATLAVNDQVYEILGIPSRKDEPGAASIMQSLVDLASRGEYGPGDPETLARERVEGMLRLLADQRHVSYQRQLMTGRWIETRLRALDSGNFLMLYRDVTDAKDREAELERQSALLSTIVANLDGIVVYDKDTRLTVWNDHFPELVGIDPSLLRKGVTARELIISQARAGEFGPCDAETEADGRIAAFFNKDHVLVHERERQNGQAVEMRRYPVPGGGSVAIYTDITARKRAERALNELNVTLETRISERTAALAETERFQRSLMASVPGMVYRCGWDGQWRVEFASEGCWTLLGVGPEALVGHAVYLGLIHPEDRPGVSRKWHEDLAAGRTFELEYRVRHSDGSWRWVLDRAHGVRDASGKLIRFEGIVMDVTGRKVAEQGLAVARDNLLDALDSLDHALVLFDADDRLVLFNRYLYKLVPPAGQILVIGQTFEQILRTVGQAGVPRLPPDSSREDFIAGRVAHHKRADGTVIERRLPDGRVLHVIERRSQSGGIVALAYDVTERLAIEGRLQESQRMEAMGRLTGGLAHDLNNYLAVIVGNLDLLADHPSVDPEMSRLIERAIGGAERGAQLTHNLVAFSRRQPLNPTIIDAGLRAGEAVRQWQRSVDEKIVVEFEAAPDLWPVNVDGVQLDNCIVNLANNSRDAMPDGGKVSIAVRNVAGGADGAPPGDHVLIEVTDTGIGMTAETVAQVFEPFFTTKEVGHGTGLGLSMVHGFVHQSGGVVRIVSAPGSGTTARIYLPRVAAGRLETKQVERAVT